MFSLHCNITMEANKNGDNMFNKKIYIEKQKNNRIFILFSSLFDVSNEKVQTKLKNIVEMFATKFYVSIKSKKMELVRDVQVHFSLNNQIEKESSFFKLWLELSANEIVNILSFVDLDKISVELFACKDEYSIEHFKQVNVDETDFYMYFSDNDGPYILFNQINYNYNKIINKINLLISNSN